MILRAGKKLTWYVIQVSNYTIEETQVENANIYPVLSDVVSSGIGLKTPSV